MKLKIFLAIAGIAVLAVPLVATAGSSRDRATGGGQILINQKSGNGVGAGDTIAFTAQQVSGSTAQGQVQFIDRTGGIGKNAVREHGEVFCMVLMGSNTAEIGYDPRGPDPQDQLYVIDGGEPNRGNDVVFVDDEPQSICEFATNDDDDTQVALARGNVQIYNAP